MNWSLLLNGLGGLAVLMSYGLFLPKLPAEEWWQGLPAQVQTWVWTSIMIAVVCYVVAFVVGFRKEFAWEYYAMMMLFFVGASLWAPMVYWNLPILVFMSLVMTTLGALGMAIFSYDWVLFALMFVVFLHCFVMDNVVWFTAYVHHLSPR